MSIGVKVTPQHQAPGTGPSCGELRTHDRAVASLRRGRVLRREAVASPAGQLGAGDVTVLSG